VPRTGRGGKVNGQVGQAYSNRSDLNAATRTVPGQEYGRQAAQRQAMQSLPMAAAPMAPQAPAPAAGQVPPSQIPMPQQSAAPQEPLLFDHPTERPDEPITHGLPVGPGAGPEVLGFMQAGAPRPVESEIQQMAMSPQASPELQRMARIIQQTNI
jgi:hypothetical protein